MEFNKCSLFKNVLIKSVVTSTITKVLFCFPLYYTHPLYQLIFDVPVDNILF